MPGLTEYLLKASISLALVWLFYMAVLRPLTFYRWNRYFLAAFSIASFLLPCIDITPWIAVENTQPAPFVDAIPRIAVALPAGDTHTMLPVSLPEVLWAVFIAGVLLRFVQLALQWASLQKIRNKAVMAKLDNARLYDVDSNISPFSFANAVFINSRLHTPEELEKIIQHEFVHVRQKHTIDLMLGEVICIVNWFNPFAWLIRKAIRQNLEFIADNTVLQSGLDARQYQYLLLKVVGMPKYSLSNSFNIASLKKRIAMINKNRSSKINLIRFLLMLPLLALVLLAFRQKSTVDLPKPAPDPRVAPLATASATPLPASQPKTQRSARQERAKAALTSVKRSPANSSSNAPALADTFPLVAPPPAPAPPAIPPVQARENVNVNENIQPAIPAAGSSTNVVEPVLPSKAPAVTTPVLPAGVRGFHQKDKVITVFLKNGETEIFHLDKPKEKAAFEKKYGAMPTPPAPISPTSYAPKDPFILSLLAGKKDKC